MSRPKWSDVHLLIPPPALGTVYRSYSHSSSNVASGPSLCMVSKNETDLSILNIITWVAVRTTPTWTVALCVGTVFKRNEMNSGEGDTELLVEFDIMMKIRVLLSMDYPGHQQL